jgi:hypothetical protein
MFLGNKGIQHTVRAGLALNQRVGGSIPSRRTNPRNTGRKSVNYDPSRVAYVPIAQRVGTRAIVHSDPRVADSTPPPYPQLRTADTPSRKMGVLAPP